MPAETLLKLPGELSTYAFEFNPQAELVAGETLTGTPTVSITPSGPTLGSPTISGSQVRFTISGGTSNTVHTVLCTVTTSGGATLQSSGKLEIY